MKFRQASLIYNPASGRKRTSRQKKVEQAREILLPWIDQVDLTPTSRRGDATRLASEAVVAGCDLVIACGGDGTINEVAGGLAGSDIPLFPLPAGTANVLAEETGLPMDPRGAAAEFPSLAAERVPLGVVHYSNPRPGSRHFLLMCGAGVDASIVYHLDTRLKDYMGQGAYWVGSIEQLQRKFESFEIRMNGKNPSKHVCRNQQEPPLRGQTHAHSQRTPARGAFRSGCLPRGFTASIYRLHRADRHANTRSFSRRLFPFCRAGRNPNASRSASVSRGGRRIRRPSAGEGRDRSREPDAAAAARLRPPGKPGSRTSTTACQTPHRARFLS